MRPSFHSCSPHKKHTPNSCSFDFEWGFVGNLYKCKPEGSTFELDSGRMFGVLIELNWITRLLLKTQIGGFSARHITVQLFQVLLLTSRTRRKPSISLGEFRNLQNNRRPNWLLSLFFKHDPKDKPSKTPSPPLQIGHPSFTPPKTPKEGPPSNPQSLRLYQRVVLEVHPQKRFHVSEMPKAQIRWQELVQGGREAMEGAPSWRIIPWRT